MTRPCCEGATTCPLCGRLWCREEQASPAAEVGVDVDCFEQATMTCPSCFGQCGTKDRPCPTCNDLGRVVSLETHDEVAAVLAPLYPGRPPLTETEQRRLAFYGLGLPQRVVLGDVYRHPGSPRRFPSDQPHLALLVERGLVTRRDERYVVTDEGLAVWRAGNGIGVPQ